MRAVAPHGRQEITIELWQGGDAEVAVECAVQRGTDVVAARHPGTGPVGGALRILQT